MGPAKSMWMRPKASVWWCVKTGNLRRVDFPNRQPSQVERTRLCDGSIFLERRWSTDQERCPSRVCNVSIGTCVAIAFTEANGGDMVAQ